MTGDGDVDVSGGVELTGDVGARQIILHNQDVVVEVEAGDDGPLVDIDTPDGLTDFLAR